MLTHQYLLVLLWAFETASGVSLVTVRTQDLENKEALTCFKSADPGAVRAMQLHGDHKDEGDLWSRDPNTSAPLPRCSSSSFSPPPSHCEVCVLEEVYMICDNLPAGTKLFLERPGTSFSTKESACPTLPPADSHKRHRFLVIGLLIILLVFLIIGVVVYKRCKGQI
ncbi:hypothetical protein ATANTOWER_002103 [Ataeniobius toweri]|uniref:Uncharacterized protein n=1 Tax=Ataeniobius toweri TaxID=208326 RepID=A0ABU7ACQ3_9TELE|nr:hypothetical protein [Ataeniobius toweri]